MFTLSFSIKLSLFPWQPELSQVFVENMDSVILQTCFSKTPLVRVRACVCLCVCVVALNPNSPSQSQKVLRPRWRGSGCSIFGSVLKRKKREEGKKLFLRKSFFLFFFLFSHTLNQTHTYISPHGWAPVMRGPHSVSDLFKREFWKERVGSTETNEVLLSLRRCSSHVGTGARLFTGSVIF